MSQNQSLSLIELESLEKEYNVLLNQYEEAYKTYITNLNSQPTNLNEAKNRFTNLSGRSFWGQSGLKQGASNSVTECESMCATDEKCSGATFNSNKNYCWTRSGEGNISKGLEEDVAIIPVLTENVIVLKGLNQKLLQINQQISDSLNQLAPTIQQETLEKNQNQKDLISYYSNLLKEKIELEKMYNEYQTANYNYQEQDIYTTQQNDQYYLWMLVAIFLLVIVFKNIFYPDSPSILVNLFLLLLALYILYYIYRYFF